MKTEFKVGDRVSAYGCEGVVIDIQPFGMWANLKTTESHAAYTQRFEIDGKLESWHKEPSLVLIDRPKQKVKLFPALCMLSNGRKFQSHELYSDEIEARGDFGNRFIRLLTDDHHAVEVEI